MSFSASLCTNLSASSFQLSLRRFRWKQKSLVITTAETSRCLSVWIVRSVLDNGKSSITDNGAAEPARILLERLFTQTQKLEEQIGRDPALPQVAELGLNLGNLESDLQAALAALKKKEEDLQDAERKVLLDCNELNHAREELEHREGKLATASAKQEKLEEELRQANLVLASQAREIEDLKLCLKERNLEIVAAQSTLSVKEDEINKMNSALSKKSAEAATAESELRSKSQLLVEANEIVKKQEIELLELRRAIQEKEAELKASISMQKTDEEKLRLAEANLEKQTIDWLVAQEELKQLVEDASKNSREANKTMEDFCRVRKLLADVRSELLSSQKALASSREKMEDQENLLEKQLVELEEQRKSVASYLNSLKDAKIEVEVERVKLRVAEAQNRELERDLSMQKDLVKELRKELDKERASLKQAFEEKSFLQEALDHKTTEFQETQNALQLKQSELVEARLEIHNLKSAQSSLHLLLEEKDSELSSARKKLEEVNQEVAELRLLMNSREEQLTQAMAMLKEKDEHVKAMQHELSDTKLKFSEAENVVERIVNLSDELVISAKDNYCLNTSADAYQNLSSQLVDKRADGYQWKIRELESELEFTRENLRAKEMEVLNAQRALTVKNEELGVVVDKLDGREKELRKMKEEMTRESNELRQLYALAQERIGEKSIGDLAIEKLQLEAAQLEIEAATSALHKLAGMSRDLLSKASWGVEADYDTIVLPKDSSETKMSGAEDDDCPDEVKTRIASLSALTEQLVKDAGIVG